MSNIKLQEIKIRFVSKFPLVPSLLVVILFTVFFLLAVSACSVSDTEPALAEASPLPVPAEKPAPTLPSGQESSPEASPELTPEPTPEIVVIEAKHTSSVVAVNGISTSLIAYEINERVYLDLFEVASAVSGTDKQFSPEWDENNETLLLTSNTPFSIGHLDHSAEIVNSPMTEPSDVRVFLDGTEVSICAYSLDGDVFFDLFETAAALDLIVELDLSENMIDIFTSRALANRAAGGNMIDPALPMVALTFDDGPGDLTPKVLDVLERYDAVATFYVIGRQIEKHSDTVMRAYEMGCEIANHTWAHWSLERVSEDSVRSQLYDTNVAIESVTGTAPTNMRPPYGRINSTVQSVSGELGLAVVFWSVDPSDYLNRTPERIYDIIMDDVEDRDIILLHDIHERSLEATRRLVPSLIRRGFQLVTVSELMYYSGISLEPGNTYRHAR